MEVREDLGTMEDNILEDRCSTVLLMVAMVLVQVVFDVECSWWCFLIVVVCSIDVEDY